MNSREGKTENKDHSREQNLKENEEYDTLG